MLSRQELLQGPPTSRVVDWFADGNRHRPPFVGCKTSHLVLPGDTPPDHGVSQCESIEMAAQHEVLTAPTNSPTFVTARRQPNLVRTVPSPLAFPSPLSDRRK